jgi:hypothetical protein
MLLDRIDAQADQLGVAAGELRFDLGHVAEFGRADRREILRMREEDGPAVADPLVEIDRPLRRFGGEVRGDIVDA